MVVQPDRLAPPYALLCAGLTLAGFGAWLVEPPLLALRPGAAALELAAHAGSEPSAAWLFSAEELRDGRGLLARVAAAAPPACRPALADLLDAAAVPTAAWRDRRLRLHVTGDGCSWDSAPIPAARLLAYGRPLELNAASAAELEALPGIGPKRAAAIVAAREEGGPFGALEDLTRVRGIGPVTARKLARYLHVR